MATTGLGLLIFSLVLYLHSDNLKIDYPNWLVITNNIIFLSSLALIFVGLMKWFWIFNP